MIYLILSLAISSADCLPQYPSTISGVEICIKPPPPDLDCSDIWENYGEPVIVKATESSPDVHRLDKDKDGVGCEIN